MPVEAKPLFRPDILRAHLSGFQLAAVDSTKLNHWASEIASGRVDRFGEQEILPHFLNDFFIGMLGYVGPAGQDRYTIGFERFVEVEGEFADAVLGDFNGVQRYVVAIEGKGPRDPLERPFAGRRMSAVDQGYRYAINLPCDWIIVTSIRKTRLYHKGSDQQTYERFDTVELAESEFALRRFIYLLHADRVIPVDGQCHFYTLLAESEQAGRELTKEFYIRYSKMRQDAFVQLCRDNPEITRQELLSCTQKLLDRILFVAFAEDRGLLPAESIRKAYEHRDPYHPRPIWENFRGLFGAINRGNAALGIHAYNGGLFADDPTLNALQVSDEVCSYFRDLGDYEYKPPGEASGETRVIDVDILGHIFEQSISDLERIRNELDGLAEPSATEKHKTRRKKEGAFYTPSFITRYIIEQALGSVLDERFEQLRIAHHLGSRGAAKTALAAPLVYQLDKLTKPARTALVKFWEAWQDELTTIRLLDPACGSGAFLIEAFDQLHATYQRSNDRLAELRGHRSLFDLDKRILENNLYGVDLNEEAIEICRLSLWIKTAERGKALTSLDHSIRVGNSVVADPAVHPKAFDWQAAYPEVFKQGGFDVVVGNPPYVRQELLSEFKPYLQANYASYHGMADLYVYFYELGLRMLKPGGLLSFIVTNKWMKAGYGEPLRGFFSEQTWVESVVDLGHNKEIFLDADIFPCILVARKPTETKPAPSYSNVCILPRERFQVEDLSRQVDEIGSSVPRTRFGPEPWNLEAPSVSALMEKIKAKGITLKEHIDAIPFRGFMTGFNAAFLVDTPTNERLIAADPKSKSILRKSLRGQDLDRWQAEWKGQWMIALKSSSNHAWPWKGKPVDEAEAIFERTYPAVYGHMKQFERELKARKNSVEFWWELSGSNLWEKFDLPKIMYQDITWNQRFCIDNFGMLSNNTVYFLPTDDRWLIAVLNAPVTWWFMWRTAQHGKDEALRLFNDYLSSFPIPIPSDEARARTEAIVGQLMSSAANKHAGISAVLDWLKSVFGINKPTQKLVALVALSADEIIAEVRKIRGKKAPLSVADVKLLKDEYTQSVAPLKIAAQEALQLERQLSDLVNEAYGLTPEEVELMWATAPPRMPFAPS